MIEPNLMQAVGRFLEPICSQYRLPTKSGEENPPRIVYGYLPPLQSNTDNDQAYVIVRPISGATGEAQSTDVAIIVSCYDRDMTGFDRALDMVARIRTALLSIPDQVLESRYMLQLPIEWHNVDDQPWPQWQLSITTHWLTGAPRPWSDGTKYF